MMGSTALFLIASTAIALISLRLNFKITKAKIRADQAFWFVWIFMIWSAETLTSFPFFDYYYEYQIEPETRTLTLMMFAGSAVGFLIGSIFYSKNRGYPINLMNDMSIAAFTNRWQSWFAITIFGVGLLEFTMNQSRFSNLLDLRLAAVDGTLQTATFYTQFFLFSQAFIMLVGFSDGLNAKVSRVAVTFMVLGLILHNLSVGGRINILVAPLLYFIPFLVIASQRTDWHRNIKHRILRLASIVAALIMTLFVAVQLYRSDTVNAESSFSINDLLLNILFAIPMYISDGFISISVHAGHARSTEMPFGYFTFDAFYRVLDAVFPFQLPTNSTFGHEYYRNTPAPWAWTQTNLIPRLVSDFGDLFWLALVPISAVVQWLSLFRMSPIFVGVVIRSLMVFSSAYTILAAPWFTSLNVYILFYAFLLYFLTKLSRFKGRQANSITSSDRIGGLR